MESKEKGVTTRENYQGDTRPNENLADRAVNNYWEYLFNLYRPKIIQGEIVVTNTVTVDITLTNNSIMVPVVCDGVTINCILDTGDAIGPVFNSGDAAELSLQATGEMGVEGAGGATTNYTTVVNVAIGGLSWDNEPAAIDTNLAGPSLIGLPFFMAKTNGITIDFDASTLSLFTEE